MPRQPVGLVNRVQFLGLMRQNCPSVFEFDRLKKNTVLSEDMVNAAILNTEDILSGIFEKEKLFQMQEKNQYENCDVLDYERFTDRILDSSSANYHRLL
jgi:hypothetical protein